MTTAVDMRVCFCPCTARRHRWVCTGVAELFEQRIVGGREYAVGTCLPCYRHNATKEANTR